MVIHLKVVVDHVFEEDLMWPWHCNLPVMRHYLVDRVKFLYPDEIFTSSISKYLKVLYTILEPESR